jgi:hypothetical protein
MARGMAMSRRNDTARELRSNLGLGSLGAYSVYTLDLVSNNGDQLTFKDRKRLRPLREFLDSAWRGAQPVGKVGASRLEARPDADAPRALAERAELPLLDEDLHNSELVKQLADLKSDAQVRKYAKAMRGVVANLINSGTVSSEDKEELPRLRKFANAMAHINDDLPERRRELLHTS